MKTALDTLIEELEAGTWGPSQDSTGQFDQSAGHRNLPDAPASPLSTSHKPDPMAECGLPQCGGCYEIAPGVRLHPPKSGKEWKEWLLKWEPKGRVQ